METSIALNYVKIAKILSKISYKIPTRFLSSPDIQIYDTIDIRPPCYNLGTLKYEKKNQIASQSNLFSQNSSLTQNNQREMNVNNTCVSKLK